MIKRWPLFMLMYLAGSIIAMCVGRLLLGAQMKIFASVIGGMAMLGPRKHLSKYGFFFLSIVHWLVCFAPGMLAMVVAFRLTQSIAWSSLAGLLATSALVGFQELFEPSRRAEESFLSINSGGRTES